MFDNDTNEILFNLIFENVGVFYFCIFNSDILMKSTKHNPH